MEIQSLYLFSGLGADERVFSGLDLSGYSVHHMEWIEPRENETISSYAGRMSSAITTERPVLIGLSFGGVVAKEAAKNIPGATVVLISSAKTSGEIPPYFRGILSRLLLGFIPGRVLVSPNVLTSWFFGVSTRTERDMLGAILKDTDPVFLKWALRQIMRWRRKDQPAKVYHIHGTHDKLLPYRYIDRAIPVHGGGHLMIMSHAGYVSDIIREVLHQE